MTREEGSPPRSFWSPTLATKGGKAGGKGDVIRRPSGAFYSWGFKVHPFLLQEPNFNNQSQGVKEKETRRANPPPWNKSCCVQKEALKLCIAEVRASSTTAWVGAGKKEKKWKGRRKGRNKKKRKGLGKMIRRDERGKKTIFLHTHARQKGASYGPPIFKIHRLLEVAGDCEDAQIFFFFFLSSTVCRYSCEVYLIFMLLLFSHPFGSDSLRPHGPQHTRPFLSLTISPSLTKFMSLASVMLSSHLILWCPLLLLPSIFPRIRDFSNEKLILRTNLWF